MIKNLKLKLAGNIKNLSNYFAFNKTCLAKINKLKIKGMKMDQIKELFEKAKSKLVLELSSVSYELWIKPLELLDFKNNDTLVLTTTSAMAKQQVEKHLLPQLKNAVENVFGYEVEIEIIEAENKDVYLSSNNLTELNESKNDSHEENSFNEKYTFENFVVGKSNQFVYAAARAVAENPGTKFNPLFIYGGVGLGKTHLLHAIGSYISKTFPKLKIKYVTCDKFTNDYVDSLRSKQEFSKLEFREKYRNLDVLLVDDIQFLSKRVSTQEEFFHTFNDLYQQNKQIILTSDRPPKEIETLTERLESRFSSGIIQDIQSPDFETRIAILRKKAQQERYFVEDNVIEYIAENINTNIREMEGMLSKVHFFSTLMGKKCATIADVKECCKQQENTVKDETTMETITDAVCSYFNISKLDIIGKKRSKEIVEPRMYAIYLINEILNAPLMTIGNFFGGRDHTTIIHARDKITELSKTDSQAKKIINDLKNMI